MDKNSDLFFIIILILVVISFIILNILKTLESNIMESEETKNNLAAYIQFFYFVSKHWLYQVY